MRWALAIVAGVLLGWTVWTLWFTDPAPPSQPPVLDGETPSATADQRASLDAPATPRSRAGDSSFWVDHLEADLDQPVVAAEGDPSAVVVRGQLTVRQRPWLHPAGVEIRLTRHWLDTVVPLDDLEVKTQEPVATTGPDGTFAFRFRPLAGELFFLIDRGGPWLDFQKVARVPPEGTEIDLGPVFVDDRGGVRGRVVQAHGQPLQGVEVRAVDSTLADVPSGLGDLRTSRADGVEHFDPRGTTAWGALPKWVARRDQLLPFPTATTDRDGWFDLRGLRPGAHDVILRHDEGCTRLAGVQVAAQHTTEVGDVHLRPTEGVLLRFVDDVGQPWIGAGIAFVHERLGFGATMRRTSTTGTVSASLADPGHTRVLFCHPGDGPCFDLGRLRERYDTLRVARLPRLAVTLVDPAGMPLAGGAVRFFATGVQFRAVDRRLPHWMQPTERAPGEFVGLGMPGTVAVASVPGHAPAMATLALEPEPMVLVPLQWTTVRVHDIDGNPVAGATVRLQVHEHPALTWHGAQWERLASDRARVGQTDERGLLDIPVWGTWFSLEASHRDYANTAGPRFLPQAGGTVDLLLYRRGGIVGTVTAQHRPVTAGFRVRARQRPPAGNVLDGSGFLAEHLAVTGADGTFAFRDLCAGIWELQPEFPAVPGVSGPVRCASPFATHQVQLDDGQTTHCTIEASRMALTVPQVAGVVRQNGAAAADVLVRIRPLAQHAGRGSREGAVRSRHGRSVSPPRVDTAPWLQQCTTDSFGDFAFAGLEPGRAYEVRFDQPLRGALQFLRRQVVTAPDHANAGPTPVDAAFETGTLVMHCSHPSGSFGNRMVRVRQVLEGDEDGACFELLSNEYGVIEADALPVGRWTIEAVHGGRPTPAQFSIGNGISTVVVAWAP